MANTSLHIRLSPDVKELLQDAAVLKGKSLNAFILNAAVEKAHQLLRDHNTIQLSREGQLALARCLQN